MPGAAYYLQRPYNLPCPAATQNRSGSKPTRICVNSKPCLTLRTHFTRKSQHRRFSIPPAGHDGGCRAPGKACEPCRPNVTVLEMFYRRAICPLECGLVPDNKPAKQNLAAATTPHRRNLPQHDISAGLELPEISFLFSMARVYCLTARFPVNSPGDDASPSF